MKFYNFVLTKTVSLEDDSSLENYTSSHAVKHDEVGDNEETIADANLWLLRLGRHKQHEQMKRVCGMKSKVGPLFYFYSSFICFRQHRDWDNITGIGYFLKVLFDLPTLYS